MKSKVGDSNPAITLGVYVIIKFVTFVLLLFPFPLMSSKPFSDWHILEPTKGRNASLVIAI